MFVKIGLLIENILQKNLKSPQKDSISTKKPTPDRKLPFIYITDVDFEVNEVGIGGSLIEEDSLLIDIFSGDDKTSEFTLSQKPLRPIISVEHPTNKKMIDKQYTIDYNKGSILFIHPPKRGKDNISIKYRKPYETKGLKFKLKYHVNIFAKDEAERDNLALNVVETLIKNEASFNEQQLVIKLMRGFNSPLNVDDKDNVFVKILEYTVEANLQVLTPHPRIEEIEIKKGEY